MRWEGVNYLSSTGNRTFRPARGLIVVLIDVRDSKLNFGLLKKYRLNTTELF